MQFLLKLTRVSDAIGDVAGFVAKWLVLLACLVSAGNASIRYLFSYSSNSWLEIQRDMFGGIALLGAAQTLRLNEHVRVDLLYSSVSDRTRLWIDIVGFTVFPLPVTTYSDRPHLAVLPAIVPLPGDVVQRRRPDPAGRPRRSFRSASRCCGCRALLNSSSASQP